MSRRYASYQPADTLADDTLDAMLYGTRERRTERPMRGCQSRDCCGQKDVWSDWMVDRLDWQLSGADLVPILAAVTAVLHALALGWRLVGVGLW